MDAEKLARSDGEVFILMTAFDEASSQIVHRRTSYKAHEIAFGARYRDIFVGSAGKPTIDISALSDVTSVAPAMVDVQ
jgi:inward rectifier potassium channel